MRMGLSREGSMGEIEALETQPEDKAKEERALRAANKKYSPRSLHTSVTER
jgi:hypothetical protein